MKPSEIIKQDCLNKGLEADKILVAIHTLMRDKRVLIFQHGESVLVLVDIGPGQFETHLYSLDSPLKVSQAMVKFFADIKRLKGLNTMYGEADNPQIINLLKSLAKREKTTIQRPDKSGYNWMIKL
jgi:hypothetical protein